MRGLLIIGGLGPWHAAENLLACPSSRTMDKSDPVIN